MQRLHLGLHLEPRALATRFALVATLALTACRDGGSIGRVPGSLESELRQQGHETAYVPLEPGRIVGKSQLMEGSALDRPRYSTVLEADELLEADDEVFVVRAREADFVYPRVFMGPHHLINEIIDGEPVLVSYCQLSEAATLFSRRVGDRAPVFGWLRSLYNGSLIISDSLTGSYWVQFVGECVRGPRKGERLRSLGDLDRMRWSAARELPRAKVLSTSLEVGACRSFCADMDRSQLGLVTLRQSAVVAHPALDPYDRGLGVAVQGESLFIRVADIRMLGAIETQLGGWTLLATWDAASGTARLFRRYVDGRVARFRIDGDHLVDVDSLSKWTLAGECVEGAFAGKRLARPVYTQSAWFAWAAFYPYTRIWKAESASAQKL